jgi:hypothetical protein
MMTAGLAKLTKLCPGLLQTGHFAVGIPYAWLPSKYCGSTAGRAMEFEIK